MNNPRMKVDRKQELAKSIGDAINSAMEEAQRKKPGVRFSQAELARQSGLTQPTINRTLKGKTIPATATLFAINQYFVKQGIELNQKLAPLLKEVQLLDSSDGPDHNASPVIDMVVEIMRKLGPDAQQRLLGAAQLIHNDEKRQAKSRRMRMRTAVLDVAQNQQLILNKLLPGSLKTGTKSR